jgi:5-methyltetrahydropteroyltriglutamate--homocysteine methyltransferase
MTRLTRAVVGSFPSFDESDIENSILKIIDMQLKYGIDILSDGEQRTDMITYYTEIIPGLTHEGIKSKIKAPEELTTFSKINDFKIVKNYLEQKGKTNKIKLTITGPVTLGFSCGLNGYEESPYSTVKDLQIYADVSTALKPIADAFQKIGALVQIDEPGLSAGYVNYKDFSKELSQWINEITADLHPSNTVMHICGRIPKRLLEIVLQFENIGTFSFAFDGMVEKDNIDIISREILEDHGKKLGFGCISGVNRVLSDPETVKSNIVAAVEKIGVENIAFIHPDCGLRVLSPENAEVVLNNMNEGAQLFENTI